MENRIILSPVTGAAAYTYTDVHAYYTHKILLCTVRESTGVRVRACMRSVPEATADGNDSFCTETDKSFQRKWHSARF